jgi:hypothetical protein
VQQFGGKIMRRFNILERDRTQNRNPLLLIALFSAIWLPVPGPQEIAGRKTRERTP